MQDWRRKYKAEEMSSDAKPRAIKKNIESSNRWKGKREIEKTVREMGSSRLQRCPSKDSEYE
jgi:hypothetical protein